MLQKAKFSAVKEFWDLQFFPLQFNLKNVLKDLLAFESWETEAGNGLEIYQLGLDYFCSKFQYEILDPSLKLKLGYFLRFL